MNAPGRDCALCPRLAALRTDNRATFPDWHNAPVPSFGDADARVLIVGLAPGLRGANRTGRPFTGDYAGNLLYATLIKFEFAEGSYAERPDDGLRLLDCRVTNAVRCLPPENKPNGAEIRTCRRFLVDEIAGMRNLEAIVALGKVAHDSVVATLGARVSQVPFGHGRVHTVEPSPRQGLLLADSYHCSRYNTNTGRLTVAMFEAVFADLRARIGR